MDGSFNFLLVICFWRKKRAESNMEKHGNWFDDRMNEAETWRWMNELCGGIRKVKWCLKCSEKTTTANSRMRSQTKKRIGRYKSIIKSFKSVPLC